MQEHTLSGLRVLVTRERSASESFAARLSELGAVPVICPAIEIRFRNPPGLDEALSAPDRFDWLLLTSANAVKAIERRFDALNLDARRTLASIRIGVVGQATEAALHRLGGMPAIVANPANADDLAARLESNGIDGALVLFPASRIAGSELPQRLRAAGAGVVQLAVYETLTPEGLSPPKPDEIDVATFTSPSAIRNIAAVAEAGWFATTPIVCIGPTTAKAACAAGCTSPIIATEASIRGMIEALMQVKQKKEQNKVGNYGTR